MQLKRVKLNIYAFQVYTQSKVWDYINHVFLPNMFPDRWGSISNQFKNDSSIYDFPTKLTMADMNSKVVTGTRLRQLRVRKGMLFISVIDVLVFIM